MTTNKELEEIYLERVGYLLSIDNLLEETLEDRYSVPFIQTQKGRENDIRINAEAATA